MTASDDEDESLAYFLESEVLSEVSDQEGAKGEEEEEEAVERQPKRLRVGDSQDEGNSTVPSPSIQFQVPSPSKDKIIVDYNSGTSSSLGSRAPPASIMETGFFSKIPPEVFHQILKFLSSEDLVSCSLVCRFLNYAASDESLWRRL